MDVKSPRIQMVERVWVGSCWAAGNGPKAAGNGLKAHFWVAKSGTQVGHVSDICPKFVPVRNTVLYISFRLKADVCSLDGQSRIIR